MTNVTEKIDELNRRGSPLRNYEPEEFMELYDEIEDSDELTKLRGVLKRIDSGRWWKALNELHKVFSHKDNGGRKEFSKRHPEMMKWICVWGMCEDMGKFRVWLQ